MPLTPSERASVEAAFQAVVDQAIPPLVRNPHSPRRIIEVEQQQRLRDRLIERFREALTSVSE